MAFCFEEGKAVAFCFEEGKAVAFCFVRSGQNGIAK